jgi:uncharacterized protein (TIGR03067 family)
MSMSKVKALAVVLAVAVLGAGMALTRGLGAPADDKQNERKARQFERDKAEKIKEQAEKAAREAEAAVDLAAANLEVARARLQRAKADLDAARAGAVKADADARGKDQLLEGKWKVLSQQDQGRDLPDFRLKALEVTIGPRKLVVRNNDLGAPDLDVSYRLFPGAAPKRLQLTFHNREVVKGIYRLEGDHLTIVYAEDVKAPYPTAFVSEGGKSPNSHLLILKRVRGK